MFWLLCDVLMGMMIMMVTIILLPLGKASLLVEFVTMLMSMMMLVFPLRQLRQQLRLLMLMLLLDLMTLAFAFFHGISSWNLKSVFIFIFFASFDSDSSFTHWVNLTQMSLFARHDHGIEFYRNKKKSKFDSGNIRKMKLDRFENVLGLFEKRKHVGKNNCSPLEAGSE